MIKSARSLLLSILVLCALLSPAHAQDYLACYIGGTFKLCPGDVRLKAGKYLLDTYVPGLDASKITTGMLDNARLSTGIDVAKLSTGTVSNTVFGYLANVTSDIQAQLNGKQATLTLPLLVVNGGTNSSTALNNNRPIVSSGGALIETASTCPAGTMLAGGSPPNCTQSGSLATQLTTPKVTGSAQLALNAATGNSVALTVDDTAILTASATGLTAAQPLAMSSQKITGLASATASGDALSYPWVTATASANTLGSTFNITAANGTYAGTGLSYALDGAGTYYCHADVRNTVAVALGAGANISLKFRDTTTNSDVSNSIRIGAYASTIGAAYITTTPMSEVITVSGADTIEVYAASNTGTTYTARSVDSDTAGYSKIICFKVAP